MKEYIEREAALVICEKEYQERLKMQDWCGDTVAWNIGYAIKAVPAAYVQPVVSGRWIEKVGRAKCSVCADECWADSAMEYSYCPNCGAKMIGKGSTNES